MELPAPRALLRPLVCLVVAPIVLVAFIVGRHGQLGLGPYIVLAFLVIVWNTYALWRALGLHASPLRHLVEPENLLVVLAYGLVWVVWGLLVRQLWTYHRAWYSAGYAVAALVTLMLLLRQPSTRRLRNYLILVLDIFGALALGAWAAADWGADGGAFLHTFAQSEGLMQAFVFSWGAYFGPILFLPPLLVIEPRPRTPEEEAATADFEDESLVPVEGPEGTPALAEADIDAYANPSQLSQPPPPPPSLPPSPPPSPRPSQPPGLPLDQPPRPRGPRGGRGLVRRAASVGIDAALGAIVVIMVVLAPLAAVNIAIWNGVTSPADAVYTPRPGFEFGAVGRAFTDQAEPVASWQSVVDDEVARAKELGLQLIRYDLQTELLSSEDDLARLDVAVAEIRAAGMDVMLSPFGSGHWEGLHPSFGALVERIRNDTLLLVDRYSPAWVLPFYEPNGQVAVNLGRMAPVSDWVAAIDSLGREVRARSNHTRILIEVANEPVQGHKLVEALSAPGLAIDAIGFDVYPGNSHDLEVIKGYRDRATNPALAFWISEFGVETVMFGQRAQSRAISSVVSRASGPLNATGLCVWTLLDDTVVPSNMGLVGRTGEPKEAFGTLRDAIRAVRGGS